MTAYLLGVVRRWVLVVCCVALAASAAAVYTWRAERAYTSSGRVIVLGETSGPDALYQGIAMPSMEDLVESPEFAARVAKRLGDDPSRESLTKAVHAELVAETTILRITATDTDPERARDIAGASVETLRAEAATLFESETDDVRITARVLDPPGAATPEDRPWWRNLGVGAALGLLVGIVLAAVRAARE